VHAQLNMVGGLILIMSGLALALLPRTGAREAMPAAAQRRLLGLVAGGMLAYYGAEIVTNVRGAQLVHQGVPSATAFARLQPFSDVVLCAASAVVLAGMLIFARFAWRTTGEYRAVGRREVAATPDRFAGPIPDRVRRRPLIGLVGIEAGGCLLGIPGAGWLEAGRPFAGLTLMCVGSSLSWAVLPLAFSPFAGGPLHDIGWPALLAWLPILAAISCTALVRSVRRDRAGHPGRRPRRERYPHRGLIAGGAGTLLFLLVCLPLIPWLADLNGDVRYSYSSPFAATRTAPSGRTSASSSIHRCRRRMSSPRAGRRSTNCAFAPPTASRVFAPACSTPLRTSPPRRRDSIRPMSLVSRAETWPTRT